MARTSIRLYVNKSIIVKQNDPTSRFPVDKDAKTYLEANAPGTGGGVYMLLGFDNFPASLKNQRLYEVTGMACLYWGAMMVSPLKEDFDPATVTWETKPDTVIRSDGRDVYYLSAGKSQNPDSPADTALSYGFVNTYIKSENARAFLTASAAQAAASSVQYALYMKEMLEAGTEPYIDVYYDDSTAVQSKIEQINSPIDGYYNPREEIVFQWDYVSADSTYVCAGDFTQASAKLYWRASGSSSYTAINISGASKSVSVPGNTFPSGTTIEWYLEGTDSAGTTSQTEVYSFSTTAGAAIATLRSPINSVEDGSAPITITWDLSSTDGQDPTAVDLQWKLSGAETWNTLLNHTSARSSFTAPAGTFTSGEVQILVRAYNVDDVAGDWSRPSGTTYYSFICVAAPDPVRGLAATSSPQTTISWQSTGQQGYEIRIDGQVVASEYGPAVMQWKSPVPLSDGQHSISVRIQGMYSMWSQASTITVQTANTVPPAWAGITLTGIAGSDAQLLLNHGNTSLSSVNVYWYRDGKRIAWTTGKDIYTDRFVLGNHVYYAELVDANGNYKRTESVNLYLSTDSLMISAFSGGSWVPLSLSEMDERSQIYQYTRTAKSRQMLGARFPVLEVSEFDSIVGTYECAFRSIEDAAGLEALKGQVVIVKSRAGQVVIGGLLSLQRTIRRWYVSYTFSVEQIDWEDFVRYDAID